MPVPSADVRQQLNDAFDAFKATLEGVLAAEARAAVDGVLERMAEPAGSLRLDDVTVEVLITNLRVSQATALHGTAAARAARAGTGGPRRPKPRRAATTAQAGKRGRPLGGVRLGVLAAFAGASAELSTAEIKTRVQAAGVRTSTDNLHQQLRRLVQAGELVRIGRGRYASASLASTHAPAAVPDPA